MLENMTWSFFEKTGSIETYLEYINIKNSKEEINAPEKEYTYEANRTF